MPKNPKKCHSATCYYLQLPRTIIMFFLQLWSIPFTDPHLTYTAMAITIWQWVCGLQMCWFYILEYAEKGVVPCMSFVHLPPIHMSVQPVCGHGFRRTTEIDNQLLTIGRKCQFAILARPCTHSVRNYVTDERHSPIQMQCHFLRSVVLIATGPCGVCHIW